MRQIHMPTPTTTQRNGRTTPLFSTSRTIAVGLVAIVLGALVLHLSPSNDSDIKSIFSALPSSLSSLLVNRDVEMATKTPTKSVNVLGKPLRLFSQNPVTGFYRNGYCDVGPEDLGNHSIAAEVTDEFLEYSASRGNDLRTIGLTGGCKWCLCASRWKEALMARKSDDDPVVPKVFLHATHEKALDSITMQDLKKFASEGEASKPESRPVEPSSRPGAAVKEV